MLRLCLDKMHMSLADRRSSCDRRPASAKYAGHQCADRIAGAVGAQRPDGSRSIRSRQSSRALAGAAKCAEGRDPARAALRAHRWCPYVFRRQEDIYAVLGQGVHMAIRTDSRCVATPVEQRKAGHGLHRVEIVRHELVLGGGEKIRARRRGRGNRLTVEDILPHNGTAVEEVSTPPRLTTASKPFGRSVGAAVMVPRPPTSQFYSDVLEARLRAENRRARKALWCALLNVFFIRCSLCRIKAMCVVPERRRRRSRREP